MEQWELRIIGYLKGWDDALLGNTNCPYKRKDWQDRWKQGYRECMENRPLPLRVKVFLGIFDNEVADYRIKSAKPKCNKE
jgi:ribosome modulation factor